MKIKKILLIIWRIIITILGVAGLLALILYNAGTWVCTNTVCEEWITGDAWVKHNCKPEKNVNGTYTDMCEVEYYGKLQEGDRIFMGTKALKAPLSSINASQFKSCIKPVCKFSVYVKK